MVTRLKSFVDFFFFLLFLKILNEGAQVIFRRERNFKNPVSSCEKDSREFNKQNFQNPKPYKPYLVPKGELFGLGSKNFIIIILFFLLQEEVTVFETYLI